MVDPIRAAADALKQQVEEKVSELRSHPAMAEALKAVRTLHSLEDHLGLPRTTIAALFSFDEGPAVVGGDRPDRPHQVRFDEFVGLIPLDAAKRYLRKGQDARLFEEIVQAIRAGGGKVESEEALRMGLSRSTLDIVKIGERYGLLEHYPQIRRGGKKRRGAPDAAETPAEDVADAPDDDAEAGT